MDLSNENIIHVKDGNIEYLQFRRLLNYKDKIIHCYTTKCSDYKEDDGNNYKNLYKSLGLDYSKLVKIEHQIHSNFVEKVDSENQSFTNIDGLLTNKNGISLSLRFADCTPILLYDPVKKVIANIHSGWRGTVQKIGQKGAKKMIQNYGCDPKNIIACIGPCIGKCHFEVDEDVEKIFEETFSYLNVNEKIISKKNKKYHIDTTLINRLILQEAGLLSKNIYESNICTVCNSDLIHSYRADKEKSGRNITVLGMR